MIPSRVAAMTILAALLPAAAAATCSPGGNGVILTVTGDIANTNRDGIAPFDVFVKHQDLTFSKAYGFTGDALGALARDSVEMILPFDKQRHLLAGPRLELLLNEVGAEPNADVIAHGIDGYGVLYPAADIARLHPILALCRDAQQLGIGDLGPGYIVFPPATRSQPTDEESERMIWGTYLLEITRTAR